MGFEEVQLQ